MPKRRTAGRARKAGVKQEQEPREPKGEREQLAANPTLTAAPKRQRKRRQADPHAPPPFGESHAPPMHACSPTALSLLMPKFFIGANCYMTSPESFMQARKGASQTITMSPDLYSSLAEIPAVEILEEAVKVQLAPRPVPNLGFACLNATLRAQKPPIFSNRDCIQRTFQAKGLDWISQLALENSRALAGLILWNHLNGIRFFRSASRTCNVLARQSEAAANCVLSNGRVSCADCAELEMHSLERHVYKMIRLWLLGEVGDARSACGPHRMSSKIFPWCTEWELDQLPQAKEIAETLAFAGQLARAYDQRLTFHPSHFVKLGCEDGPLLDRSLKELEVHSLVRLP